MKKQILKIFFIASIFFALPDLVEAATYYVRTDGGTAAQCSGLVDAAYPGSGIDQDCAWSHPFYALPPVGNGTPRIVGGDSIFQS